MRTIWVRVDPWDKELVTTALEGGADAVMVPPGDSQKVKELAKIPTIAEDGDLKLGQDLVFYTIQSQEDEPEILRLSQSQKVILECPDWQIIPLENLIAQCADVVAQVNSLEDAQTAFGILEKGVDQILLHMTDSGALKKALSQLRAEGEKTELALAEITEVRPVGMGDRVCVTPARPWFRARACWWETAAPAFF